MYISCRAQQKIHLLSTGVTKLDSLLHGGLPAGCLTEVGSYRVWPKNRFLASGFDWNWPVGCRTLGLWKDPVLHHALSVGLSTRGHGREWSPSALHRHRSSILRSSTSGHGKGQVSRTNDHLGWRLTSCWTNFGVQRVNLRESDAKVLNIVQSLFLYNVFVCVCMCVCVCVRACVCVQRPQSCIVEIKSRCRCWTINMVSHVMTQC